MQGLYAGGITAYSRLTSLASTKRCFGVAFLIRVKRCGGTFLNQWTVTASQVGLPVTLRKSAS